MDLRFFKIRIASIGARRLGRTLRPVFTAAFALTLAACGTSEGPKKSEAKPINYETGDVSNRGYRHEEAKQFVEFCVELDNQDDRVKHPADPVLQPHLDSSLWNPAPIFDSRRMVARDVVRFRDQGAGAAADHWHKLYEGIIHLANAKYPAGWNEDTIFNDPDLNGFGPWQNAWLLYQGKGAYANAYAIAIRGTVFSNEPSAVADAWFHPVVARRFLSATVQFADFADAALHSGFAHATFTLMLDDRYGVLRILHDSNIASQSRVYIVGHSQGAAMATLTHAFLHYALRNDNTSTDVFGLRGRHYRLKSYAFAQPKPGNYTFSSDFAGITQRTDNAIVINNHIDPVPKVPLTLQSTGDLEDDFHAGSVPARLLRFVSGFSKVFRSAVGYIAEPLVRKSAEGYSYFYQYERIKPLGDDATSFSWDFVPAGRVLTVFGTPGDPNDAFLQHHATTYRKLIEQLQ